MVVSELFGRGAELPLDELHGAVDGRPGPEQLRVVLELRDEVANAYLGAIEAKHPVGAAVQINSAAAAVADKPTLGSRFRKRPVPMNGDVNDRLVIHPVEGMGRGEGDVPAEVHQGQVADDEALEAVRLEGVKVPLGHPHGRGEHNAAAAGVGRVLGGLLGGDHAVVKMAPG